MAATKAIFITGASSGIGLATAKRFDTLGWRVFAGVLPGEDTTALQQGASDRMTIIPVDITSAEMVTAAQQSIARALGDAGLDGLFNNAGIPVSGPMELVPLPALEQIINVNVMGHVRVTQAFLPLVRKAQGRIVNTASILGRVVTPFGGPYCMTKFAMEAYTDALRMELAPWGIHVVAIEPGVIATPIWEKTLQDREDMDAELTPEGQQLYGTRLRQMRDSTRKQSSDGSPPEMVAAAVEHAMTAPTPRTRYLVGKQAHLVARMRWLLPDRLFDRLLSSRTGY